MYRDRRRRDFETGVNDTLSLDWGSETSNSMFDAGDFSGTLLDSLDEDDASFSSTPTPGYQLSGSSMSSSSSDDTAAILGVVGKSLDMLGSAIPSIAGDPAKQERAEKAKLEAERLRLEQARLQAMAGMGTFGPHAGGWGPHPSQHGSNAGMSQSTKIGLGVLALAGLALLWPKGDRR